MYKRQAEYNPIDGVGMSNAMNTTGKKGTAQVQGVPGLYKNPANEDVYKRQR